MCADVGLFSEDISRDRYELFSNTQLALRRTQTRSFELYNIITEIWGLKYKKKSTNCIYIELIINKKNKQPQKDL